MLILLKRYEPSMTILEAKRTTLADFVVIQQAWNMRQVDERFMASYVAWQTRIAQGFDKKNRFKDLFDYDKELKSLNEYKQAKTDKKHTQIFDKIRKLNKEKR